MNFKIYKSQKKPIAFCFVDNTHTYTSTWTRELVKNQADFTITNITSKGYDIYQGHYADQLLKEAAILGHEHAVVFSTGTEFINGYKFFEEVEKIVTADYFLAGHVLDRGDAYYELHHQCYLVNLSAYKELGYPSVGQQELGSKHVQVIPERSKENIHDDYTPLWVRAGSHVKEEYQHKCHGWNILSTAFEHGLKVLVWSDQIRNNKKHYYPENQQEFLKHSGWIYKRQNYCLTDFVHTSNTDWNNSTEKGFRQVFTPASGIWWMDIIDTVHPVKVVFYDYNQHALDYWQHHAPKIHNVEYDFVRLDLLADDFKPELYLDNIDQTFINLSNIYAYEGTTFLYSLEYRLNKEDTALRAIKEYLPNAFVNFSARAASGLYPAPLHGRNIGCINLAQLDKPTWHSNDWI